MDCAAAAAGRTRPEHCNASDEESKRKQFHDGEHGVKVEEGRPQQRRAWLVRAGAEIVRRCKCHPECMKRRRALARVGQRTGQKMLVLLALM